MINLARCDVCLVAQHDQVALVSHRLQKRVREAEDELRATRDDLEALAEEREDVVEQYETRVRELEDEVSMLSKDHEQELQQAQSDMKTAMKAVREQGSVQMEEELKVLREKLQQEKARHIVSTELVKIEKENNNLPAAYALCCQFFTFLWNRTRPLCNNRHDLFLTFRRKSRSCASS